MKKALCILLSIMVTVALVGCAKPDAENVILAVETVPASTAEATTEMTTEATSEETTEATEEETIAPTEETLSETNKTVPKKDKSSESAKSTTPANLSISGKPAHVHDWEDVVTAPTCTASGYTTHTCKSCGETYKDSSIKATGHTFGSWKTILAATETATGKAERKCASCGKTESRTLDKLPPKHTHSYTSSVTAKATCDKVGTKTFICSCGDTYTEDIPKTAHTYKNTAVSATCTQRGYTEHTCTVCKSSYRDAYTNTLPHSYTSVITTATCTAKGYTTNTCKNCGHSYRDSETVAKGHTWGAWVTTKQPTETATGSAKRTCSACNASDTKTLDKLPHTHSYTAKVTKTATCSAEGVKTFTCACGNSYTESIPKVAHSYKDRVVAPTCTAKGYTEHACSLCSASYKDKYTDMTAHVCTSAVTVPTCIEKGYTTHACKNCGYSYKDSETAAKGHSWTSWVTVKEATVTSTGLMQRECNSCHKTETQTIDKIAHTHSYTSEVQFNASCTETGIMKYTCSCGDSYTDTIPAKGHTFGEWDAVTAPTSDSTGLAMRSCTFCGLKETKVLDKLPPQHVHSYSVIERVDSSCESDGYVKKECSCGDITTETIPAAHNWEHFHQDQVTHKESGLACHCGGWTWEGEGDYFTSFTEHCMSFEDWWNHSYYNTVTTIVDVPYADYDFCTACGAKK